MYNHGHALFFKQILYTREMSFTFTNDEKMDFFVKLQLDHVQHAALVVKKIVD